MTAQNVKPQIVSARPEMTAAIMAETGLDEQVLRALVQRFYDKVRRDAVLGPIFEARISDWAPHLDRMVAFWSSVALMTGRYHGRPVPAHAQLPVDAEDFERWLGLFRATARETCTPEGAAHVIERAGRSRRMQAMSNSGDDRPGRHASPPCMAPEVAPDYFDPLAVDPEQARDVARWRRAERARLRAERDAVSVANRNRLGAALIAGLRRLLADRFDGARDRVFSAYWPIKGEPDLRPLMTELHENGATVALPLVEVKAAPLVFRRWTPETRMVRGDWNIPVPPPDAAVVMPDITLAPLVGWDGAGYRLGYGGGYFDRTLAALTPLPATIGIGVQSARLATIYPQPHDIPLDIILTEAGVQVPRDPR